MEERREVKRWYKCEDEGGGRVCFDWEGRVPGTW